ncbi:TlpA family protein disulfide reductase [Pseudidiomarina taiwanensis]|nr:TlpA disulfide reductase family protein [Pseudidiomarina taiwanensis]
MPCRLMIPAKFTLTLGLLFILGCTPAPDFHTNQGAEQRWEALEGQYVVVNYFAEWCAPCLRELPELNEFHHLHGDQVSLFGVSFDGLDNVALADLQQRHQIEFPLILNQPAPYLPFPRPEMLPATYIVTPTGEVKGPLLGEQSLATLRAVTEVE